MDRFTKYFLAGGLAVFLACSLIAVPAVHGQQGVPGTLVQQSPTDLQACTTANATAAVNNQVTLTLTPPNGLSVYVCGIDVDSSQDATSTVNTNVQYTSTNLGGWAWKYSLAATVNINIFQSFYFNHPIKSTTPGIAVTIVSPTAKADTAFSINGYYYFAP